MPNISQETIAELQSIRQDARRLLARANRLNNSNAFEDADENAYTIVDKLEDAVLIVDDLLYEEADIPTPDDSIDVSDIDLGRSAPPSGSSVTGF